MKYGFIIDNRKCIGCHACTTACKSEHDVPVGVNRTWVKQVEKGEFPDTRRLFSVMRCNHCTDAPCVSICPTEALNVREDGIVDFDSDRCIGCKSCMQACPYDALYIDPETHTAAKCNYCAHRIDLGLEPACVNVCPEEAIISGNMEDPNSKIAKTLSSHAVKSRKPEKATQPNLFYIDADDTSLIPSATEDPGVSLWGSQSRGVGHFAEQAEKMAFSNSDLVAEVVKMNRGYETDNGKVSSPRTIEVVLDNAKQVYNTPDKGILWGWEVSAYVWTKAISAGAFLVPFLYMLFGGGIGTNLLNWSVGIGLVFLLITGVLLVMDLDRPDRFLYVLMRPQWGSWLVKGGYFITVYGGLLTFLGVSNNLGWVVLLKPLIGLTGVMAGLVAIYTAFLFAQAKGRDFWQGPTLFIHMLVHSVMAGAGTFLILSLFLKGNGEWTSALLTMLKIALIINLITIVIELFKTHHTVDAKLTVRSILNGRYKSKFWGGVFFMGNIAPIFMLLFASGSPLVVACASIFMIIGIYFTEQIWVEAPQRIPLS